nr:unnamed protein product [Spirometra erinaceieuropaei]
MCDMPVDHNEACKGFECECCRDITENVNRTFISNIKRSIADMGIDVSVQKKKRPRSYNSRTSAEQKLCIDTFERWSDQDQIEFLCCLLSRMSHSQHSQINKLLEPLLQRDFIIALQAHGVSHLAETILSHLDAKSLLSAELVLEGHTGSVLCLQYEGNLLISGSSDSSVRLWDLSTGECLHTLRHHSEAVLHLRFRNNILVTCSKDRSIAVWDMGPYPQDIQLRQVLAGHRAAVNVVDFDEKFIVSASGDRTIKVWTTDTANLVRTLTGHRRGIACLQYRAPLIVSGSSDNTIRIWDIETGVCFRVLDGHDELVRCIRFDSKRIVSGAYDGKIKVWNLKAALNSRSRTNQLCMLTLHQHTGRVFRLQFDDFQIVSSSHDDSIIIWDFVSPTVGQEECDDGFADAPWCGQPMHSGTNQSTNPVNLSSAMTTEPAGNAMGPGDNEHDSASQDNGSMSRGFQQHRQEMDRRQQHHEFIGTNGDRMNDLSSSPPSPDHGH